MLICIIEIVLFNRVTQTLCLTAVAIIRDTQHAECELRIGAASSVATSMHSLRAHPILAKAHLRKKTARPMQHFDVKKVHASHPKQKAAATLAWGQIRSKTSENTLRTQ